MHDDGAFSGEPAEREGTPRFTRRAVGKTLIGAAAGLAGAAALADLGTRAAALADTKSPASPESVTSAKLSASSYRLFGTRKGPKTAVPTGSAGLITSLTFELTTGGGWLEGYWLWVCEKGQSTKPQKFTLWLPYLGPNYAHTGEIVTGSTVTSKKLVPGQWNYVPLPHAVPLSIATYYQLETGAIGGVPLTNNVWGPGDPWAKGVTNGPLFAPSSGLDSADQCAAAAGSNPSNVVAVYSSGYPFFWLDVQITTKAPAGSSYRLWPSMPRIVAPPKGTDSDMADTNEQSAGTEFWLSTECKLDKIWFFSPIANPISETPAATLLPGACAIFDIATQAVVEGTLQGTPGPDPAVMPYWRTPTGAAAKPGDGWVYCAYEGITLPPGKYKTAVYCYGGGTLANNAYYFFQEQRFYFGAVINDTTGAFTGVPATVPNGIANGPLYTPNVAKAAPAESNGTVPTVPVGTVGPGNSTYQINDATNTGMFLYPDTFDTSDDGETRWIDVEVTPA